MVLLVVLGAAVTGTAGALVVSLLPHRLATPMLAVALSVLALAPAMHALLRRGDLFQPIVPIGLFFFLDFGMRTLVVDWGSDLADQFVFLNIDDTRGSAIALAALALGLIYVGYYAPWWRRAVGRIPQIPMALPAHAPWMVLGLIYAVGVIARGVLLLDRGSHLWQS